MQANYSIKLLKRSIKIKSSYIISRLCDVVAFINILF